MQANVFVNILNPVFTEAIDFWPLYAKVIPSGYFCLSIIDVFIEKCGTL